MRYWDGATRREQVLLAFGEARSESYEQCDAFASGNSVVVGGWFDVNDFDVHGGVSIGGDAINVEGQIIVFYDRSFFAVPWIAVTLLHLEVLECLNAAP